MRDASGFGRCPILDIVLKQSTSRAYTGLAVTLVTVCCLLACQSVGISISKMGPTSLRSGGVETAENPHTGDTGIGAI